MDWPIEILRPASCTSKNVETSWLDECILPPQLGGLATADAFRCLCEVAFPSGLLRRCLPRDETITHLITLSTTSAYLEDPETLARLLEAVASLSSVKFVGGAYACALAPCVLDDGIRDLLVRIEDISSPELIRATLAAMKSLEVYALLRQSWTPSNRLNPRLTREQWDALLCLAASWTTLVLGMEQPDQVLQQHTFALVAAIGALFINSQCSLQAITGALVKKESSEVGAGALMTQLMEASGGEWDDDLDCYSDCEDDGTVPEMDLADLPADEEDENELNDMNFEDVRRLAPPALIKKDWREFFSGNTYHLFYRFIELGN